MHEARICIVRPGRCPVREMEAAKGQVWTLDFARSKCLRSPRFAAICCASRARVFATAYGPTPNTRPISRWLNPHTSQASAIAIPPPPALAPAAAVQQRRRIDFRLAADLEAAKGQVWTLDFARSKCLRSPRFAAICCASRARVFATAYG